MTLKQLHDTVSAGARPPALNSAEGASGREPPRRFADLDGSGLSSGRPADHFSIHGAGYILLLSVLPPVVVATYIDEPVVGALSCGALAYGMVDWFGPFRWFDRVLRYFRLAWEDKNVAFWLGVIAFAFSRIGIGEF